MRRRLRFYPRLLPAADQVATLIILVGCYGSMRFPTGLLASCLRRWHEADVTPAKAGVQ